MTCLGWRKQNWRGAQGGLQLRLSHLQTWLAHTGMHWEHRAFQHSKGAQCSCTLGAGLGSGRAAESCGESVSGSAAAEPVWLQEQERQNPHGQILLHHL